MGAVSRIVITGATGFIGHAAVVEARKRGLHVVAVLRGAGPDGWAQDAGITLCPFDLTQPGKALAKAMQGADAVIHAAGHLHDTPEQAERLTRAVLRAMQEARVPQLVLVSSLSVYDTMALPIGGTLTEDCPLEQEAQARDGYVLAKLVQERLCGDAAAAQGFALWRLRPGAVFGPGRVWNAHIGPALGPAVVRLGGAGQVPLCHVTRCGWALVQAAVTPGSGALNILDDDLPTRARFIRSLRRAGWPRAVVPLPWQAVLPLARILKRLHVPGLPGLLREPVLRARITPLEYSNAAMRSALGDCASPDFEPLMTQAEGTP